MLALYISKYTQPFAILTYIECRILVKCFYNADWALTVPYAGASRELLRIIIITPSYLILQGLFDIRTYWIEHGATVRMY